jgi:oligopeptide transport system substrate-binding protein
MSFERNTAASRLHPAVICIAICSLLIGSFGCGKRETRVATGIRDQILHLGNGAEPEDLDPQITTGVQEDNIIRALIEGLVSEDPKDLHPVPGMAESWDISPDGRVYTFHIRTNAFWSNGDPVTAEHFITAYQRALSPKLANQYAYMLFYVVNAEAYNKGTLTNFNEVGFKAVDQRTLQISLNHPTSYFLSLLNHHSWFPVHVPTIEKYGSVFERGNRWTRPGHFVGNGPFVLTDWRVNRVISVKKNPLYWDADRVRLNEIRFYPIESLDAEERAFRSGQLHATEKLPLPRVDFYRQNQPELLLRAPYLGTYFYMFNTRRKPFDDKRVRQALALAIDREAITARVTRGGEEPAYSFTPPNTAGYTSRAQIRPDVIKARQLLAEAGYPD